MATDVRRNGAVAEGGLLDETNLRLIAELQVDARMSLAELGRRVGLSSPAVSERVRRLELEGVITGYRAEVNPRRGGYGVGGDNRVRPAPRPPGGGAGLGRPTRAGGGGPPGAGGG